MLFHEAIFALDYKIKRKKKHEDYFAQEDNFAQVDFFQNNFIYLF